MIRRRRHWIVLVRPGPVIMTALGLILAWAALSPGTVIRLLHVTSDSPEPVLGILQAFYEHGTLCAALPLAIASFMFLISWGLWSMSYFEFDDYGFTYKIGPFAQNTIPLRAIQDIRTNRSALGLLFGYGTLIVDSGREEETLRYVPRIDEFVATLRGGSFR
jgi:Bacterial PH domain